MHTHESLSSLFQHPGAMTDGREKGAPGKFPCPFPSAPGDRASRGFGTRGRRCSKLAEMLEMPLQRGHMRLLAVSR